MILFLQSFQRNGREDIHSSQQNKIQDSTKVKTFSDYKINITQMIISDLNGAENMVGKGENVGYQDFLIFSPCFQRHF